MPREIKPAGFNYDEAAAFLGIGKTTVYELVRQRKIPWMKIGARTVIPKYGLLRWLHENAERHAAIDI